MKKIIRWIINNKVKSSIIILGLLVIFIPIIINAMYMSNKGYITVWGGDYVLLFYGSVLTFIGTVFLGGLALWQNERLNEMNKNLTEHQYKPILTNSIFNTDPKEDHNTWFRTIEQNCDSKMINNGYSSKITYHPYLVIGLRNIGLGPAINIATYLYKLTSVEGLDSLGEIAKTNIDNFYDKIHFENYKYYENDKILSGKWQIYTDFNLGISAENNLLNLVFSFENIIEPLHSIIELQYENILGNRYRQLIYMSYTTEPSLMPISKIYQ